MQYCQETEKTSLVETHEALTVGDMEEDFTLFCIGNSNQQLMNQSNFHFFHEKVCVYCMRDFGTLAWKTAAL